MIFAVVVMPAMAAVSQAHHGIMYFVGADVGDGREWTEEPERYCHN